MSDNRESQTDFVFFPFIECALMLDDRSVNSTQILPEIGPNHRVNCLDSPTLVPVDRISRTQHEFVVNSDIEAMCSVWAATVVESSLDRAEATSAETGSRV